MHRKYIMGGLISMDYNNYLLSLSNSLDQRIINKIIFEELKLLNDYNSNSI